MRNKGKIEVLEAELSSVRDKLLSQTKQIEELKLDKSFFAKRESERFEQDQARE